MKILYPVKRLSRRQFSDALRKGLGRAYLYTAKYGIDDVADLVLKACLNDQADDPQSEPSKADYLFGMFKNTKYLPEFKEAILGALKSKRNTWDVQLLLELALQMATAGDIDSSSAIRDKALKKARKWSSDEWLGAKEFISLFGITAAIELARIYGSRLLRNPEEFVSEGEIFPSEHLKNQFRNVLVKQSQNEPELKAYSKYLHRRGVFRSRTGQANPETPRPTRKKRLRTLFNVGNIIEAAENKIDEFGIRFRSFGLVAKPEELETLYKRLLTETDPDIIWRLLMVFANAKLPTVDRKIVLWAYDQNCQVRESAIEALAQNADERIHYLAKEKLKTCRLKGADAGSIGLFVNNYKRDDAELITKVLFQTNPNKIDAHQLARDIIKLSKKQRDAGLGQALKWAYEKTPCSVCRYRIVEQLDLIGRFQGKILAECQFDGNRNIAQKAHERIDSPIQVQASEFFPSFVKS